MNFDLVFVKLNKKDNHYYLILIKNNKIIYLSGSTKKFIFCCVKLFIYRFFMKNHILEYL